MANLNPANWSARSGWNSSKVFYAGVLILLDWCRTVKILFDCPVVVKKHRVRFSNSLCAGNVEWETLPVLQDIYSNISRRYSHAACYYGNISS